MTSFPISGHGRHRQFAQAICRVIKSETPFWADVIRRAGLGQINAEPVELWWV